MNKKWILLGLLFPGLLLAQFERPGSSDGQFLKIGVSARGTGMGDAFISVVSGAEAVYYNEAALAWLEGTDLVVSHTEWFAAINHEFAAAAHRLGNLGTMALSITALYTDEMLERTPLQPDGTGKTFYAANYRVGLSYARHLTDQVSIGGTVSYIYSHLFDNFNASAVAGDISMLYVTGFRNFRFGMKIANFGSELTFVNESYPLPTNFTFGLSMNALDGERQKVLVSISAVKPNDGRPLGQLGAEWNWNDHLFLRAGYKMNYDAATFSLGAGLHWTLAGNQFRVDYSYTDYSLLGGTHRMALGVHL